MPFTASNVSITRNTAGATLNSVEQYSAVVMKLNFSLPQNTGSTNKYLDFTITQPESNLTLSYGVTQEYHTFVYDFDYNDPSQEAFEYNANITAFTIYVTTTKDGELLPFTRSNISIGLNTANVQISDVYDIGAPDFMCVDFTMPENARTYGTLCNFTITQPESGKQLTYKLTHKGVTLILTVDLDSCIGCGNCFGMIPNCPKSCAITDDGGGLPHLNVGNCIGCGQCLNELNDVCPLGDLFSLKNR